MAALQEVTMVCDPITAQAAARALAGLSRLDPRGVMTEGDIDAIGEGADCLRVTRWDGPRLLGTAVMVMRAENGVAWIDAAKGTGEGMTAALDAVAHEWARRAGCTQVGCQTARPGLRAMLEKAGWSVTGWVMRDAVQ